MRDVLLGLGRAVVKVLASPGLQAVGAFFGAMTLGRVWYEAWDEPTRWELAAGRSAALGLMEPPPLHPERLCGDVPLSELELRLARELDAVTPEWPTP
ncbi:hypothetical protein QQY24_15000 [Streptomyces sp. TG1A-8]|uniref:DUF6059 family protein n=1 Tax=Streptomyces sp. TG1A-8 TaxID=3051385 RepID=UPI00265C3511|nr:DUF6059 family protein [Streptomyces sp. TG1A-8]MDO0926658.1 hypothetical protein [Streptomyces sp. TG1A-8]